MINDTPWSVILAWAGLIASLSFLFVIAATPQWM